MSWDRETERKAGKTMNIGASIFCLVFAIFWCIMAASMGAWFMLIFGIPFVGLTVYRLVMILRYAKSEENGTAEPWDRPAAGWTDTRSEVPHWESSESRATNGFCPYCGAGIQNEFDYCPKCGRKLK